jgi:fatty acid desaturase
MAHHRHTQVWAQDGELDRPRYTLKSYLLWMSGVTYWYTRWRRIARFTAGKIREPYLPPHRHAELIREARWHVAGYTLVAALAVMAHSGAVVLLWLAPLIAMKCVHQLQNTIEHLGLAHTDDLLSNTRSTRTNPVMRWLAWQMQYHTAHHAFPAVPFHRLRQLDEALFAAQGLAAPSMSYWGFQIAVVRALSGGKTEADYSDESAWIAD